LQPAAGAEHAAADRLLDAAGQLQVQRGGAVAVDREIQRDRAALGGSGSGRRATGQAGRRAGSGRAGSGAGRGSGRGAAGGGAGGGSAVHDTLLRVRAGPPRCGPTGSATSPSDDGPGSENTGSGVQRGRSCRVTSTAPSAVSDRSAASQTAAAA